MGETKGESGRNRGALTQAQAAAELMVAPLDMKKAKNETTARGKSDAKYAGFSPSREIRKFDTRENTSCTPCALDVRGVAAKKKKRKMERKPNPANTPVHGGV